MQKVYFTTKVATSSTFCNRQAESDILTKNINKNQHTVIVAPRRYGKTSLVSHTLAKLKYPTAGVDLFCVVYEEEICIKVAKGISNLIQQLTSFSEKTIRLLEQCFKSAYLAFSAGQLELKVEFSKPFKDPINQLQDLLEGLELLAKKRETSVILFFDEFQDVLKIDETNKIQAAIRAVAQHSHYVTYIFSGSSRRMLNKIFDDKNQPLYMLCDKIMLDKIEPIHIKKHIQLAAKHKWKKTLNDEVISLILQLTESHPYYVNFLCDKLWELSYPPNKNNIESCWNDALSSNKGKIIADLEILNTNRLKVLTLIASMGTVNEPNSKTFLDAVKLPLTSTQNTVKFLLDHDYLYQKNGSLGLIDPLMKKFIVDRLS